MTPFQQQFEILINDYPNAIYQQLPSGAILVIVPNFCLSPGWTQSATTIKFLAPVGYPFARPDCFWADDQLRLANGGMPQNSNITLIPETNYNQLWFSWHVAQWNPNRDNLSTYIKVIQNRFKVPL
jgi:hypothetical protein